jgi:hypothetical protein
MNLIETYPATEEQKLRSQRWATRSEPPRESWDPPPAPHQFTPYQVIGQKARDRRAVLQNLIGSVYPGATVFNPQVMAFDEISGRTTLNGILVPPQEPFSRNFTARPYTFVIANGAIESFKPTQETLVPVPHMASSKPPPT